MNLSDLEVMLVAAAPSIVSAIGVVITIARCKILAHSKDNNLKAKEAEITKMKGDLATIRTKLSSIEKYLVDKENKK